MRAVGVHPDAVVVTSRIWQTTCTAIRAGDEAMLVDSPYFPDELDALPALLQQAGFEITALLATHADYDHLLGRAAFPQLALGVGESTAIRLRTEPGRAQKELRDADAEHYVDAGTARARVVPVAAGSRLRGARRRGARAASGRGAHRRRHRRLRALGRRPVRGRLPLRRRDTDALREGLLEEYGATLARLAPLVEAAETIVPGHGSPHDRDTALRLLDEDLGYLDGLDKLPPGRDTPRQRAIHADNVMKHG